MAVEANDQQSPQPPWSLMEVTACLSTQLKDVGVEPLMEDCSLRLGVFCGLGRNLAPLRAITDSIGGTCDFGGCPIAVVVDLLLVGEVVLCGDEGHRIVVDGLSFAVLGWVGVVFVVDHLIFLESGGRCLARGLEG